MESLHDGSSSSILRGRLSFNNGSHGGRGGRGRGARVARGIQDQKLSFNSFDKAAFPKLRSAYVSNSNGFSVVTKGEVQEYGRLRYGGHGQICEKERKLMRENRELQSREEESSLEEAVAWLRNHSGSACKVGWPDWEVDQADHMATPTQIQHCSPRQES
ncbi:hypothetical protein F0562_034135 [Nyssa sinensis]|uniref:Uncharacterized protein n=1 Tax=Nyssa sinensis TaxID=561372 RepID=A0A5J5AFA8_9ASTE|nr:hypothetical protein F0562_034135 [Nyssa sinensis]